MVVDAAAPAETETANQEELDTNCESCPTAHADSSLTNAETIESAHSDSMAAIETHLIIVDSRIENYEQLLENLVSDSSIDYQVAILNAHTDGIQQITDLLAGQQSFDAIHIASHGSAGSLQLGSTTIDAGNLATYQSQFSSWAQNLSEDADILLYGCDVAGSLDGQWLVNQIGEWSGADIAASDDLTGHDSLGGDWEFEYVVGAVETDLAFSIAAQQNWVGTLDTVEVTTLVDFVSTDANLTSVAALNANPGMDGVISLREALIAANANADADVIQLGAGIHTLSITGSGEDGGDLDINENVQIIGAGSELTEINAIALMDQRVFNVVNNDATFQHLTIRGDVTSTVSVSEDGGGIRVGANSVVTVDNVVVTGLNSARSGGGIANFGTLTVTNSTFSFNEADRRGGAIASLNGSIELDNVTINNNDAFIAGGGVHLINGTHDLTNVTVSGNRANVGGGINVGAGSSTANLTNVTITNNTALDQNVGTVGAGGLLSTGVVNATQSIIAGNFAANNQDLSGNLNTDTNNIIGDTPGLLLDVLADNGGPVETHALLPGSDGIDATGTTIQGQTDARGFLVAEGGRDIGAFEFNATNPAGPTNQAPFFNDLDGNPTFVLGGDPVTLDADVTISSDNFDGSTLTIGEFGVHRLRINGVQVAIGQPIVVSQTLIGFVGSSASGAREFRFNSAATNALVNELMQSFTYEFVGSNPPSSFDLDWAFDDGTGGLANGQTTIDLVEPTLDLYSGIEINTDDGNNAYFISDTGLSNSLTATTFEIQFRANPDPDELVLISFNNAAGDEYSIQTTFNNELEIDFGPGLEDVSSAIDYSAVLKDGQFHSLAVTWDSVGGAWAIYLDGVFVDSGTGLNPGVALDTTGGQFVFGQEQDGVDSGYTPEQRFSGTMTYVSGTKFEAELKLLKVINNSFRRPT